MGHLSQRVRLVSEEGFTGNLTSEPFLVDGELSHIMLAARTVNAGGATTDVIIQHAPAKNPESWFNLETFDTITGSTPNPKTIHLSPDYTHTFSVFRAIVSVSGGNADVNVDVYYGDR